MSSPIIPCRADTLQVLRLMGQFQPILMLSGDEKGYGARWILAGQQVQPATARFLMECGFIAEVGKTDYGARQLALTDSGNRFREKGLHWWSSLNFLQKMKITLFG